MMTNEERTQRMIQTLLVEYKANPASEVTDTLADLMHFCGDAEIDFWHCVDIARGHYRAELETARKADN